jgi:hypothetical protein
VKRTILTMVNAASRNWNRASSVNLQLPKTVLTKRRLVDTTSRDMCRRTNVILSGSQTASVNG